MIQINIKTGRAEKGIAKLGRKLPTKTMDAIWEIADRLQNEMRAGVPYWHGNLQSSIVAKPEGLNRVVISALFYWQFVEKGHEVRGISGKLKGWILQKAGVNGYMKIVETLKAKGAMPHPFVEPSINIVRKEVHNILKKHLMKR